MFFRGAEKKLKAAKALKEKGETPEELLRSIKENEKAAAEAQREAAAWKAIVGEESRREEAAKAEAERIATEKAEAERKAAEERKTKEKERKERDENGQPFVVSSDGTTTFGEITEDTGLTAAPIKLSEGVADEKGNGYGLRHIEARHGDQIRKAGFSSVEEFVKYVASNYDKHNIKIGKKRANGVETYLIQAETPGGIVKGWLLLECEQWRYIQLKKRRMLGRIPNILHLRLPCKTSLLCKLTRIMVVSQQTHTATNNILLPTKVAKSRRRSKRSRAGGFITDLSHALGLKRHESSQYGTFETPDGKRITIRVSKHNARVSNFDKNNENEGISIVISSHKNKGLHNDGNAHIIEYFYPKSALENAEGKHLAEMIRSVSDALAGEEFKDTTGLAKREEVNGSSVREHSVYHGSGADFDAFDHPHMGEGEGAQAYGWGPYVTEMEGIGRTYAIQNTTTHNDALRALQHDVDAISDQLNRHRDDLKYDEEQLKRANEWRAEAELDYDYRQ